MQLPLADSPPPDPGYGQYGWIVAIVATVLGALGTFWKTIRGDKREDTTSALTHANRIIAGYERYVGKQDVRIGMLEKDIAATRDAHRKEMDALWLKSVETEKKERLCQMRLGWLCEQMRAKGMPIPELPFGDDRGESA